MVDATPSILPYFLHVLWKSESPAHPFLATARFHQSVALMSVALLRPMSTDMSLDKAAHLAAQDRVAAMGAHQELEGREETVLREGGEDVKVVDQSAVLKRRRRSLMPRWRITGVVERRQLPMVMRQPRLPLLQLMQQGILRWRSRLR